MNETFNIQRFGRFLKADSKAFISRSLMLIIILCFICSLFYIPWTSLIWVITDEWSGRGEFGRIIFFFIYLCLNVIILPMYYGKVTDKKKGTDWLMLPASSLEKSLSMILLTTSATLIAIGLYLGVDALICLIDKTCGATILGSLENFRQTISDYATQWMDGTSAAEIAEKILNPIVYLDNVIAFSLVFLLGAIYFKRAKAILTILGLNLLSFVISIMIILTFFIDNISDFYVDYIFSCYYSVETLISMFTCLILCGLIYLRIKTLKH